LFAPGVNGTTF